MWLFLFVIGQGGFVSVVRGVGMAVAFSLMVI
jgi:hypothetical protein